MSFTPEKALELLREARNNNRLAHAYLITGPRGSGKERVAASLIMEMASVASAASGPSLFGEEEIGAPEAPADASLDGLDSGTVSIVRPESKSRRITVDAMREAEKQLYMAAPEGTMKFAVVVDADRMGDGAANAFLKTLEEPPQGAMVLLLSEAPEQLLTTILSRCIKLPLRGKTGPLELGDAERALLDQLAKVSRQGPQPGISAALGVMGKFTEILKEEKAAIKDRNDEALKAEAAHYQKTSDAGDYLKAREEYFKGATEAEYLDVRNRLIEFFIAWFGDALRQQTGVVEKLDLPDYAEATGSLAKQVSAEELLRKIAAMEKLRSHLSTNVYELIALEHGFIGAFA